MPARKQPSPKQPPPSKACKCTVCNEDFSSYNARRKHFNIVHKPGHMEVETPRKKAKRKATTMDTSPVLQPVPTRKQVLAPRSIINEADVRTLIKKTGNRHGDYRINFRNNSGHIDINNYSPADESFGLSLRGCTTTVHLCSDSIREILKDGLDSSVSDTDFYEKYKNVLKKM